MNMNYFSLSVIIPLYNSASYISRAIESLYFQTKTISEIIVVDDGSLDAPKNYLSKNIYQDKRLKWIEIQHQGVSTARNTGVSHSSSNFISFMDSDDFWYPQKWEFHLHHLEKHLDCLFSFSAAKQVSEYGPRDKSKLLIELGQSDEKKLLQHDFKVTGSASSVVMRRDLFEKCGGFNPKLQFGEDWDLWIRASKITTLCSIPTPLIQITKRKESAQYKRYPGLRNFHLTSTHVYQWNVNLNSIEIDRFSDKAVRILWSDVKKNLFHHAFFSKEYKVLFNEMSPDLLHLIFPKGLHGRFWKSFILLKVVFLKFKHLSN